MSVLVWVTSRRVWPKPERRSRSRSVANAPQPSWSRNRSTAGQGSKKVFIRVSLSALQGGEVGNSRTCLQPWDGGARLRRAKTLESEVTLEGLSRHLANPSQPQ